MSRAVEARVAALDWAELSKELDDQGSARVERLLTAAECRDVTSLYPKEEPFRSRVVMAKHGFGRGEYKYFAYPLPQLVSQLRAAFYPHLAPIANRWNEAMRTDVRFP